MSDCFPKKAIITYISTSSILKSSFLCSPSAIGAIALLEACQPDGHKGIPHFSSSHSLMIGEAEHFSVRWLLGNIFAHHPITDIANLSTGIFERVIYMKWMELVMFILNFVTDSLLIYLLYVQNLLTYSLFWRTIIAFICMWMCVWVHVHEHMCGGRYGERYVMTHLCKSADSL